MFRLQKSSLNMTRFSIILCSVIAANNIITTTLVAKTPVPTHTEQEATISKVMEIFGKQMEVARKSAEKSALAEAFLKTAQETKNDLTARYVLLRLAQEWSVKAGELESAILSNNMIIEQFELDADKELQETIAKYLEVGGTDLMMCAKVAEKCCVLAKEYIEQDKYEQAIEMMRMAHEGARKTRNFKSIKEVTNLNNAVIGLRDEYNLMVKAKANLIKQPEDANSNLIVGRWLWFRKNDSFSAMPHLAKVSDPLLKEAAAQEIAPPRNENDKLSLADQWWALSQITKDETVKQKIALRAIDWYQHLLPMLSGLDKAKAEKRISETKVIQSEISPLGGKPKNAYEEIQKKLKPVSEGGPYASVKLVEWSKTTGGNGNIYGVLVFDKPISWDTAKSNAESHGGHLVTITSPTESAYVNELISKHTECWIKLDNNTSIGPFLGAFQEPKSKEPGEGWKWVTDEKWSFTNWHGPSKEPNDGLGGVKEDMAIFMNTKNLIGWCDNPRSFNPKQHLVKSCVIEFDR